MKPAQSKDSLRSTTSELSNEVFRLGDQVKMKTGGRVGVVAFIGQTDFQTGIWIGVILDRPEGKNNGSVDGRVYFKCPDKYGVFCRPNNLVKLTTQSAVQSPIPQRSQQHRRVPSPTNSIASSYAPSIAASQIGGLREHSPFALEYGYDIGDRVNTNDGRAGKIKFLNSINGQVYAGILLDKPVGNSSGEFNSIQYFKCYPKYAVFLPAEQVKRATRTESALPPKIAPKQTTSSKLRTERRGGLDGFTNAGASSWRGSMESLDSAISPRSPKSPQPKYGGSLKQSSLSKDNEIISGLKKCLQEKEAHLTKLTNELEERRCDSERLAQENKSLKLRVGELDFNIQELTRERVELQHLNAENEKKLEDLSFCYTESQVQRSELEDKLNELKKMPALFEDEEEEGNFLEGENSKGPSISALIDSQLLLSLDEFNKENEKTFVEVNIQTEVEEQQINLIKNVSNLGTQTENNILNFKEIGSQTDDEKINENKENIKVLYKDNYTQMEEKKMVNSLNQTEEKSTKDFMTQTLVKLVEDFSVQTEVKLMNDFAIQTEEEYSKIIKINTNNSSTQTLIENKELSIQTLPLLLPKKQSISLQTEEIIKEEHPVMINFVETCVQTDDFLLIKSPINTRKSSLEKGTNFLNNSKLNETLRNSSFSSVSNSEVLELNVAQLPFNDIFSTPTSSDDKNLIFSPNCMNEKLKEKCQDVDRLEQQNSFLNKIIADQQMVIEQMKKMSISGGGKGKEVIDGSCSGGSNNNNIVGNSVRNSCETKQRRLRLYCEYCERFDSHSTEECPIEEARREEKLAHIVFTSNSSNKNKEI